jgi:indolepyruvate ferredoxin oxidoreductase
MAALAAVTLDDKYALESGRVYLNGTQALVRLPMMQRQRDKAVGLDTACFITGYRGSPLGGFDQALSRARKFLQNNQIHFQPGVNEDLAATAVWGSQQAGLFGDNKHDGVFSIWYGKGPGVDRSGDVLRHGNLAGASPHGGVLALAGDDHTCKSSTTAHQSEYAFMDYMMPILAPSNVQEILDLGLHGWAMSRYSGCWIAFKVTSETIDSAASIYVDPKRVEIVTPTDFDLPPDGLHIRWPDTPLQQEMRLHKYKAYAALAYARANKLNRAVIDGPKRRFGIVTGGKSYLDVRQALDDLGIDEAYARDIGLSIYKVGMTWPLEREGVRQFAEGLEEILVVEEKRALMENQFKEQLYNWKENVRPRVIGKFDEERNWILPSADELTPARIARVIAKRIARFHNSPEIEQRLAFLAEKEKALAAQKAPIARLPYFCSGCPHNTSTRVPEGSRALAGIGCHYMVQWMDRRTDTFTQMGGEGVTWVGQAPFSKTKHVFQNLGDGTYYHSGLLAIRACIAAGVNITYKILYNDAVAMTGGQPMDGPLDVPMMAHQVAAEGIKRIAIVSDEPEKYPTGGVFPPGTTVHHRDELDHIQREFREIPGVTVIIYDQTCAAEKRRRRKRGLMPDPDKRVVINELVCEGCGDCGTQSNCLSVVPVETEFGRKRAIDQSSCNKDFSCLKGFCPSFVTVRGGKLRKRKAAGGSTAEFPALPEPKLPALDEPYGMLITGIGGTGVVTIGALLGMAAHLEGKGCTSLDMTGLAQKGGAVFTHMRIAQKPEDIHAVRIAAGSARLLLGCDMVTAASFDSLAKVQQGKTWSIINSHASVTGDFNRKPDMKFPAAELERMIEQATGAARTEFIDGTHIATTLMGDSIATNLFMLGYAHQKGLVPVSAAAIERAIELNAAAIESNKQAFLWGRRAAHDRRAVEAIADTANPPPELHRLATTLEEMVARRADFLTGYQNAAYAERYKALVERVARTEQERTPGRHGLAEAVARYYFKLLAYKDEYEVARLYTDGSFKQQIEAQFEGDYRLEFNLAPPLWAQKEADTGHLKKRAYGPWMLTAFRLLAKLKGLRGTAFDIFGYAADRRMERQLIADYERTVDEVLAALTHETHGLAIDIASIPEQIRGYGHIKHAHLERAKAREAELLAVLRAPAAPRQAAE